MCSRLGPLVLGLVVALAATAAAADEWTSQRPADISRFGLSSIAFEGPLPVPEGELKSVLRSSTSGLVRFRAVDPDRLEGDAQRLRAHLRRLGYWKADVTVELLFDPPRRTTRAVFHVVPGEQRRVGRITTAGNQAVPEAEILSWLRQRPGEPFDLSKTDRDRTALENTYANRGFYEVQVTADIQPAASDSTPIVHDLVYRITEGPRFMVGNVRVEGNEFTKADIIRRELVFHPGDVLSREQLDDSRARLYATGYFSTVTILPEKESRPEAVDVVVKVTERRMRYVGAGVGYGTRDQLRLSGEWGHRNLWGRGKRGSVRGILATELFPANLVRTRFEGRYVEPWLFNTRTTGSVELSYERREEFSGEQKYNLSLVTLVMNASRQLGRHTRGWATLENEWADVDLDPGVVLPDDPRPDLTRTVSLTAERDRRNDFFEPTRGFLNRFIGSVSGGVLGGDNNFWRFQVESQWFRTLGWLTLAGRIRTGYEQPFGPSDFVPDRQRFKLGGPTTVRGYDYQEIGPGDFLALGNFELRFPLVWRFSGGLFVDGGNAWEDVGDVRWKDFRPTDAKGDPERAAQTDVRYSVGGGLRFATPVGPVRVDAARRTKILPVAPGGSEEPRWGYDFSLGHAF
jgi:outer membrane protein insertion porin family